MVDDGSTDGSAAIAESFARRDERFRLVTQPNGGLSRARNTGTDAAGGRYLAFLDSDDVLPPNSYELLLGALEKTGSDFATGNVHRLTRFGTRAVAVPRARVRRDPAAHARDEVPAPDRRPDRLEQALAALVLGPPRLPLPRGPAATRTSRSPCRRTSSPRRST